MKRLDESLDNLFEAFSEMVYPTKDQVKKALADEGIDPEKITTDGVAFAHKLLAKNFYELDKYAYPKQLPDTVNKMDTEEQLLKKAVDIANRSSEILKNIEEIKWVKE